MDLWQDLQTLMIAVGLMQVLLGKEVMTADGVGVGLAADLKLDLKHHKIWVLVEKQGTWSSIPSEQIAVLPGKAVLLGVG